MRCHFYEKGRGCLSGLTLTPGHLFCVCVLRACWIGGRIGVDGSRIGGKKAIGWRPLGQSLKPVEMPRVHGDWYSERKLRLREARDHLYSCQYRVRAKGIYCLLNKDKKRTQRRIPLAEQTVSCYSGRLS